MFVNQFPWKINKRKVELPFLAIPLEIWYDDSMSAKRIGILNPRAGKGGDRIRERTDLDVLYQTKGPGDARDYVRACALENPQTHFFVFGGDGTVNEAVSGIMLAGAGGQAALTVVPGGSGNNLMRSFEGKTGTRLLDVIRFGDHYAINVVNIGFDCDTVKHTSRLKKLPGIGGTTSYLLGAFGSLFSSYGLQMQFHITTETEETEEIEGEYMLCVIANCQYYGGSFHAAPTAKCDDGLLDVLLVKRVSRMTFLALINDYKRGTHIDACTGAVKPTFQKYMRFLRCKQIQVSGMSDLCADGEIITTEQVQIEVIPKQIRLVLE